MGCCNNKKECDNRKEAMLDATVLATAAESGVAIIGKLMEIAATGGGIMYLFKDNPKLNELAAMIKMLASENQYLKKKLGEEVEPTVIADPAELTFTFGPKNVYSLTIPAGSPERRSKLAGQLVKAAAELISTSAQTLPGQQVFPFAEE
jgi:hypothetical protein